MNESLVKKKYNHDTGGECFYMCQHSFLLNKHNIANYYHKGLANIRKCYDQQY